jgi:hypothetical protein
MERIAEHIDGYDYGTPSVARSPVTLEELVKLKITVGWTAEDDRYLQLAGQVLKDQTKPIIDLWRGKIIASIPHLARHSRTPEGEPLPDYARKSGLRFEQWIIDTCFRSWDQDWLDYQNEIALRHMAPRKNQTDGVCSTPFVPFRDIIAFVPAMNETIKPFLAAKGHSAADIDGMHCAWIKSLQLQIALWAKPYSAVRVDQGQW